MVNTRGIFRTQSNIYDEAFFFFANSQQVSTVYYFPEKAPP